MPLSAEKIVLIAKERQIEELRHLAATLQFVAVIGHLVHNLQAERGASSLYLASGGRRFAEIRLELAGESEAVERELRATLEPQLKLAAFGNAKLLHLLAWALLGLDEMGGLRQRIHRQKMTAAEAVAAFSRLMAGLIAVIFEIADAGIDPRVSGRLVAFFNLVQGKEIAGQERAVGALSYASGLCDGEHQQRLLHLIDAQDRHFRVFEEFASDAELAHWRRILSTATQAELARLRQILLATEAGSSLDPNLSNVWFDTCSERLSAMWVLQCVLMENLREHCQSLIAEAQTDLKNSRGLLQSLREHPPAAADLSDRFFDPAIPVENALGLVGNNRQSGERRQSIIDVLQAQSQRLASMEEELGAARRALDERKVIERAKGMLMAHFHLSEEAAYRRLRSASMEQNRRLSEVAESVLTLTSD